jgi:hypothetical protein
MEAVILQIWCPLPHRIRGESRKRINPKASFGNFFNVIGSKLMLAARHPFLAVTGAWFVAVSHDWTGRYVDFSSSLNHILGCTSKI